MSETTEPKQNGQCAFRRTPTIAALSAALAKAQGEMSNAEKSSANPYYHSRYADLAAILEVVRKPLSDNALALMQPWRVIDNDVEVETLLTHSSGEEISMLARMPGTTPGKDGKERFDVQSIGSTITYLRRYSLQSLLCVAGEDDDGNAAAAAAQKRSENAQTLKEKSLAILRAAVQQGTEGLKLAWEQLTNDMRAACKNELAGLKAEAAKHDSKQVERDPGEEG